MSEKRDEFQELIRSFSLDQQSPQSRPAATQKPSRPQQPAAGQQRSRAQAGDDFLRQFQQRPASAPPPQQRPAAPRPAPPPQRPAESGRFSPSGFEAQAGKAPPGGAVRTTSVAPPKNFQLRIDNEEYRSIPDNARTGRTPGAPPPRAPHRGSAASGGGKPPGPPKKKRKRRSGGVARFFEALIIAFSLVGVAVFLSIFGLQSVSDLLGINKGDQTVKVKISSDYSMSEIAQALKDAGLITQPFTFQVYAMLTRDDDEKYITDEYDLNTKMAYSQILDKLVTGNKSVRETVRITFPEGYTIVQIAQELEKEGVCTAEEFFDAADNGDFSYEFEKQVPSDPLRFHRLEGYIFPDTYDFFVPEPATSVVDKFLKAFNTNVTQDLYDLMDKSGMTLDQTITLASIIQKEAGDVQYMYDVSSVFHNRLLAGMPFESDATTDYIEKQLRPNVPSLSQAMIDAYDSYVCPSFPIGPINNPGMNAINAALDPAETGYYFFLSDQKGEYHFSETLAQHQKYMLDAGDAHGTATGHDEAAEAEAAP